MRCLWWRHSGSAPDRAAKQPASVARRKSPAARQQTTRAARATLCVTVLVGLQLLVPSASSAKDALVYELVGNFPNQIWKSNEDGTDAQLLAASGNDSVLSPTGHEVAYFTANAIKVTDVEGLDTRTVVQDSPPGPHYLYSEGLEFHPTGRSLVYACMAPESPTYYDLCTVGLDGTPAQRVITWPGNQGTPSFSPDGTRIVFHSFSSPSGVEHSDAQIYVADPDGSNAQRLTAPGSLAVGGWQPDFGLDGDIVFTGFQATDGWWDIFSVNADGTNLQRLTNDVAYDDFPAWTTSGKVTWTHVSESGPYGLVTMNADGTGRSDLMTSTGDTWAQKANYRQESTLIDDGDIAAADFRPVLRFDSEERWRPVDLRALFEERDETARPSHRLCIPLSSPDAATLAPGHSPTEAHDEDLTAPNSGVPEHHCERVASVNALDGWHSVDAFLDLNGRGPSSEADTYQSPAACVFAPLYDCDRGGSAIYYTVTPPTQNGYRYIDYWMFYRFNDFQPSWSHEGDWEGVEIVPSLSDPETFDFVSFSGHGHWYSYLRENLECDDVEDLSCVGALGSAIGQRVRVYPAAGSHANYPQACAETLPATCPQASGSPTVREHDYDGAQAWGQNYDATGASLVEAQGAGWFTWPGVWGASDLPGGPASPGNQPPDSGTCADNNNGCLARPAALGDRRSGARRRDERHAQCRTWFGPAVVAALCGPKLGRAVRKGRLGRHGNATIEVVRAPRAARLRRARASTGSVVALAQTLGPPLRAGDMLRVRGRMPKGSVLLVRGIHRSRRITRRFTLARSQRQFRVKMIRRGGKGRLARVEGRP
jgi:Tol biopolymer transport system component